MKNLTWQNPEQLFVAQELINKVKSKCCGIKDYIAKIRKKPRDVDALPHTLNKNYVFVFRFYAWKIGYFFIFVKVKTWCYGQVHQSFHRRGLQADFRSVRP